MRALRLPSSFSAPMNKQILNGKETLKWYKSQIFKSQNVIDVLGIRSAFLPGYWKNFNYNPNHIVSVHNSGNAHTYIFSLKHKTLQNIKFYTFCLPTYKTMNNAAIVSVPTRRFTKKQQFVRRLWHIVRQFVQIVI